MATPAIKEIYDLNIPRSTPVANLPTLADIVRRITEYNDHGLGDYVAILRSKKQGSRFEIAGSGMYYAAKGQVRIAAECDIDHRENSGNLEDIADPQQWLTPHLKQVASAIQPGDMRRYSIVDQARKIRIPDRGADPNLTDRFSHRFIRFLDERDQTLLTDGSRPMVLGIRWSNGGNVETVWLMRPKP